MSARTAAAGAPPRPDGSAGGDGRPPAVTVRGLAKRYGEVEAVARHRLRRARGRDLRLPRAQRRGQVDDDRDALHARAPDRRPRDGRRPRRRRRARRGPPQHRPRLPGHDARRLPDAPSRTCASTPSSTACRRRVGARPDAPGARDGRALGAARRAACRRSRGGMKRRLEIARGLLHSPRVLFLDEPTVGLDPQTRSSIWGYIRELKAREDITIFLTTHYMDEAEYCDRIAIMDQRRDHRARHARGAEGERRARTACRSRTDDDDAAIAALRERFGLEATMHEGLVTIAVERGGEFVPRLFAELGVPIKSVSVSRPSLDDVFMSYTGTTIRDAEATASDRDRDVREDDGPMDDRRAHRDRRAARGAAPSRASTSPPRSLARRPARGQDRLAARADPLLARPAADHHLAAAAAAVPVRARQRAVAPRVAAGRTASTCARSSSPACWRWR